MFYEKKTLLRIREFLNGEKHHSTACINFEIIKERFRGDGKWKHFFVFEIADCSRKICLDFDVDNQEEIENSLNKISKLKEAINSFEKSYRKIAQEKLRELEKINEER